MGFDTVFPDMVMDFADIVTNTVETGEGKELSDEDVRQVAAACRETREKFSMVVDRLRKMLTLGVDPVTFVRLQEPFMARIDGLCLRNSAILAAWDRLKRVSSETRELIVAFEEMGVAMSRFRDVLKEALSKMKMPHRSIDWQRVEEVQEAFRKGETRPFKRTTIPRGN